MLPGLVRPKEKATTVASYDEAPKLVVSLWEDGRLAVRNPRLLNVSKLATQSRMGQMVRPPVTFATHRLLKFFEHGSFNTNQHRLRHHICRNFVMQEGGVDYELLGFYYWKPERDRVKPDASYRRGAGSIVLRQVSMHWCVEQASNAVRSFDASFKMAAAPLKGVSRSGVGGRRVERWSEALRRGERGVGFAKRESV